MTTKLAWKNIGRNRTRTLVFVAAAFFGFGVAIFAINLMKSIAKQRTDDAIAIQSGHLQIHKSGFIEDKEIGYFIERPEQLIKQLDTIANFETAWQSPF